MNLKTILPLILILLLIPLSAFAFLDKDYLIVKKNYYDLNMTNVSENYYNKTEIDNRYSNNTGDQNLAEVLAQGNDGNGYDIKNIKDLYVNESIFIKDIGTGAYKEIYANGNNLYFDLVHGIFGYSLGIRGNRGSALGLESAGTDLEVNAIGTINLNDDVEVTGDIDITENILMPNSGQWIGRLAPYHNLHFTDTQQIDINSYNNAFINIDSNNNSVNADFSIYADAPDGSGTLLFNI